MLNYFASIAGLKIKSEKTKLVWIGSKKFSDHRWKLEWVVTRFNVLGIYFDVNLENMELQNYIKKNPKFTNYFQYGQGGT